MNEKHFNVTTKTLLKAYLHNTNLKLAQVLLYKNQNNNGS